MIKKITVEEKKTLPHTRCSYLEIKKFHKPEWYFKKTLTDFEKEQLKNSVVKYGYGLIITRLWSLDHVEVIDGNNRISILKELGVKQVYMNYLGKIPLEDAILLSRLLNHTSSIDWEKYSAALTNRKLWKIDLKPSEIANRTPEKRPRVLDLLDGESFQLKL